MPNNLNIKTYKNILLPRFDTFGDIVLLQGFISALSDYLQNTQITLLVRRGYEQLAPLYPERLIWKTTSIVLHRKPAVEEEIKPLLNEIVYNGYDLLLTTTYNRTWLDDLIAVSLPGVKRLVLGGPQGTHDFLKAILVDLAMQMPECLYDEYIPVEENMHETEKYQVYWNHIAPDQKAIPRPQLVLPEKEIQKAGDVLEGIGLRKGEFVFCFPAGVTNVSFKTWPEENFAEVIVHLEKKQALKTLIAGHKKEKGIVDQVAELARRGGANPAVWLGKGDDIPLACALAAQSLFYFGNDTGLMHMSAALGKPIIAIFGGGTWPRFLPAADCGIVLTQELPCASCLWRYCWLADAPCIRLVAVEQVVTGIERFLNGNICKLEIHKGLSLDNSINELLEKGNNHYKRLHQELERAEEELLKSKKQLSELHKIYEQAVDEIEKRDNWLAELRDVYHQAVDEIQKRDNWVSELKLRNAELKRINEQAMQVLPLVSIITPVFNGAKWIDQCIQSVLNQDYPNLEHIIVDGGSTDATLDICSRYPHLIVHSQKDRGQSHAINKGFALAQGDILAWLCADDEYEPGAVKAAVKGIIDGHAVVMGYSRFMDAEGNIIDEHPANRYERFDHGMLLRFWKYGPISQPAIFWTRKMWDSCGPVKENLFFAMDYDLWLRMSRKTAFRRIDAYTARYRLHPEAKCYADNFGPRVELIKVSRQYWPPFWSPVRLLLKFQYRLTRSSITQHYAEGANLINEALRCLDSGKIWGAMLYYLKAQVKHPAAPLFPEYRLGLKRMLKGLIGPGRYQQLKEFWKKDLRVVVERMNDQRLLRVHCLGYRRPQFRFWGKKNDEFVLLRDWGPEDTLILLDEHKHCSDYGVHVRSGNKKDLQNQAWVINEQ
ncbi:MAG: hypothetical protein A2Y79_10030 [Deltaproteobacteria bacterium RBG_13_43_22]|nr:MAG: hypothetical protein A2Y79_10030 [Deltaproteobacteria bacterium RBG_13_43_22]